MGLTPNNPQQRGHHLRVTSLIFEVMYHRNSLILVLMLSFYSYYYVSLLIYYSHPPVLCSMFPIPVKRLWWIAAFRLIYTKGHQISIQHLQTKKYNQTKHHTIHRSLSNPYPRKIETRFCRKNQNKRHRKPALAPTTNQIQIQKHPTNMRQKRTNTFNIHIIRRN